MDSAILETTSQQYLGQWKRLASARRAAGLTSGVRRLPQNELSDETWSASGVGGVAALGAYAALQRFGMCMKARSLFWSRFQAALDRLFPGCDKRAVPK